MVLVRMRIDEMVSAWVGDVDTPFQLGLLGVFEAGPWLRPDGTVDLCGLRAELATCARGVPELRRRPVWTHVGEGRPVWAEDPSFDPLRHIRVTTSTTGDDILAWAANRSVHPLELDRPLWCAELVGGLTGGRFAVLLVVHHVLADGLAGVRILGSLFDASSDAVLPGASTPVAGRLPTHLDLVRDGIAGRRARHRRSRGPDRAHGRRRPVRGFRRAMEGFRTPLPTMSLPRHVGPARRLVASSRPLESVRRTGHALGATVNDLVLAVVTEGLRDLLAGRGELTEGLFLRATVPVATGRPGQAMGMLVVDLPVAEPDPGRRLSLITAATRAGKTGLRDTEGDVTDLFHVPWPVLRVAVRWGRRAGSSRINLSVSNVTGPPVPLWLAGAQMVTVVPVAPLVPLVPLSAAAISYAGSLSVAVNADASIDDLPELGQAMARSFRGYEALAARSGPTPEP